MYNPYCMELKQVLTPCNPPPEKRHTGLIPELGSIKEDDLLLLLLLLLLWMDGEGEKNLPLLGALLYLLL